MEETFSGRTLNMMDGTFHTSHAGPATEKEIYDTVKVMGGEDWEYWMEALEKEGLVSSRTRTVAYSYLGPEHSWPIYRNGTIGKAKEDLERACDAINKTYTEMVPVDRKGRIRIDDQEMREDVQKAAMEKMAAVTPENVNSETDVAGFEHDFLEAHGFDIEGVDYSLDVDPSGNDILTD
ncbi:MAG: hypothetical protein LBH43_10395 [Treponema sp.]|nr:hypothetical protein [Treponema sp.]